MRFFFFSSPNSHHYHHHLLLPRPYLVHIPLRCPFPPSSSARPPLSETSLSRPATTQKVLNNEPGFLLSKPIQRLLWINIGDPNSSATSPTRTNAWPRPCPHTSFFQANTLSYIIPDLFSRFEEDANSVALLQCSSGRQFISTSVLAFCSVLRSESLNTNQHLDVLLVRTTRMAGACDGAPAVLGADTRALTLQLYDAR
jgi:hypothetical protein